MDVQLSPENTMRHQPNTILEVKERYKPIASPLTSSSMDHEESSNFDIYGSSSSSSTNEPDNIGYIPDAQMQAAVSSQLRGNHSEDEQCDEIQKIPKVNSRGKVKKRKCKHCDFVANTKLDYWKHSKTHIKPDKQLKCPNCPFITSYKHHLKYHISTHMGSKPYKCDQCDYSCVNKPMLNSHLKTHLDVYQYRCASCNYATKYCNSFKLHLQKFNHEPAIVLNPNGTPNPSVIDIHGKPRKTKKKIQKKKEEHVGDREALLQNVQSLLSQLLSSVSPQLQHCLLLHLHNSITMSPKGDNSQSNGEEASVLFNGIDALEISKSDTYKYSNIHKGYASNGDSTDEEQQTTMFNIDDVIESNESDNTTEEIVTSHES